MIETRLLRYFLAIAREQNITKAADTLHVTQSTLSKQMMELEGQLGKQLLIRGKRKVTLTEEGHFLRKQAQEIMELMDKTESAFSSNNEIISGDVYLGCAETPAMQQMTEVFCSIHADYPEVHFHLFSGDAEQVMEKLDKGLLDVGILQDPPIYERFEYQKLPYYDVFGILMPKQCPWADKDALTLADIETMPLIFPHQVHPSVAQMDLFGKRYKGLHVVATYSLLYNATFMVEQGIGYAFCLDGLTDTSEKRNLTFRPFNPPIEVDIVAVSKKYQPFSPAAKVFMDRIKK